MAASSSQAPRELDWDKYVIPGEVTVHEVRDMKRAFDMIDDDKSGRIDAEKLQGAATALGIPMDDNIRVLLGPERITFDEFFKRMTAKLSPQDTADDIMSIFELFDQDGTGTISFENLVSIGRIIGAKENQEDIAEALAILDTDEDGEIDPLDFYVCLVSGMRLRMEEDAKRRRDAAETMHQDTIARMGTNRPLR
eukprot:TRINITY_DN63547_c0_g1_i1.p1 TRINITY_DN63547_c0_g1~~TRINITY_DN63547_c0_g1_i1.p1  ORF type:complete len:195 (-),score=39.20 TRINITY_DN63547_c0_g1_i1:433-1017(-)